MANIEDGAQVNKIDKIIIGEVEMTPDTDKAIHIKLPKSALASQNKVSEAFLDDELANKINSKADSTELDTVSDKVETMERNVLFLYDTIIFDCGDSAI